SFIRELAKRHEVSVLATSSRDELDNATGLRDYCQQVVVVPLRTFGRIRSCGIGALRGEPLQAGASRMPEVETRLRALFDQESFDVVHVEHFRSAYVRKYLPPDVRTVFDSVDSISLLVERTMRPSHSLGQRLLSRIELGRTRRYESQILQRFERVAVTSAEDAQALRGLAPGADVTVIPN